MQTRDQRMNAVKLAAALGFESTWVIRGIKKANAIFAAQGREPLIFSGRYSTPAKVSDWLDVHPEFVASWVLRKAAPGESPAPQPHPPRRVA